MRSYVEDAGWKGSLNASKKIGKQGYPVSKHKRAIRLRGELKWRWDKTGSTPSQTSWRSPLEPHLEKIRIHHPM